MKHLRILNVENIFPLDQLPIHDLPNLTEVTIQDTKNISLEFIENIMERWKKLVKLNFVYCIFNDEVLNILTEKYGNVWNIVANRDWEHARRYPKDTRSFLHVSMERI